MVTRGRARAAVLGGGAIGQIVANALMASGSEDDRDVVVTTRTAASARRVRARYPGLEVLDVETVDAANAEAVDDADLVVLAVKPYLVPAVLYEIAGRVDPHALVVCVAAGVRLARLERVLPPTTRLARILPNTPTRVGRGVIGICPGRGAGVADELLLRKAFEPLGQVVLVDEVGIDLVSAVSGSGPAYLYFFAERMIEAASRRGMDPDVAADVVRHTLIGAAALAASSPDAGLASLRVEVTSPRGTTERALARLEAGDLAGLVGDAVDAALARTAELDSDTAWT